MRTFFERKAFVSNPCFVMFKKVLRTVFVFLFVGV